MIETQRANSILDKLLREKTTVTTNDGPIEIPKYLGFSTTEPVLDNGIITNFTEPAPDTGYLRLQISEDAGADLGPASGAKITNSKYNLWCKNINAHCQQRMITELQQQVKELQEWKDANKPTGICETCTTKSLQAFDICWSALTCIDHIINHSEQIVCLNSDEIKKIREVLNTVDTKLHKIKEV